MLQKRQQEKINIFVLFVSIGLFSNFYFLIWQKQFIFLVPNILIKRSSLIWLNFVLFTDDWPENQQNYYDFLTTHQTKLNLNALICFS